MNKASKTWTQSFSMMVIPLALGLAMYLLLTLLISREVITNELLLRYLTGHPISKITTFLFFVGIAGLLLIANNVFDQFCGCDIIKLDGGDDDENSERSPSEQADGYLRYLDQYQRSLQKQYLWQRLNNVLSYIKRTDSTAGIEDELKYLADSDEDQQQQRYAMVRIVIWATPMLGFLGTVLGISQALGGIQVGPDNDFQSMLNSLRSSLFVAFDTTALALTLSMLLMFLQFFIDRFERQLLVTVQRRTHEQLLPIYRDNRFLDPHVKSIEEIGRTVLGHSERLVQQQADQWTQAMEKTESAWSERVGQTGVAVADQLQDTFKQASGELADSIGQTIEKADRSMADRFEQWQVAFSDHARQLTDDQRELRSQIQANATASTQLSEAIHAATHDLADSIGGAVEKADDSMADRFEKWNVKFSENVDIIKEHQQNFQTQLQNNSNAVQENLKESLSVANEQLVESMVRAVTQADQLLVDRLERWKASFTENARQISDSQHQLQAQTELLEHVFDKLNNVADVQNMLDKNLDALATTSRLHETIQQLASAIRDIKTPAAKPRSAPPSSLLKIHRQSIQQDGESREFEGPRAA